MTSTTFATRIGRSEFVRDVNIISQESGTARARFVIEVNFSNLPSLPPLPPAEGGSDEESESAASAEDADTNKGAS